jgi:hypothetical protein
MKSDAHRLKNSVAAPPKQLPASVHCLIASQGRGPNYVSNLNDSLQFEEVHHV